MKDSVNDDEKENVNGKCKISVAPRIGSGSMQRVFNLAEPAKQKKTVPIPFSFATEERKKKRQQFEETVSKKRSESEMLKAIDEEKKSLKEKEDLIKLRRNLVHKALPYRVVKPFETKQSLKKPTVPKSPKLGGVSLRHTTREK